jgi:hypothetical protein
MELLIIHRRTRSCPILRAVQKEHSEILRYLFSDGRNSNERSGADDLDILKQRSHTATRVCSRSTRTRRRSWSKRLTPGNSWEMIGHCSILFSNQDLQYPLEQRDGKGKTMLYKATESRCEGIVHSHLEAGANPRTLFLKQNLRPQVSGNQAKQSTNRPGSRGCYKARWKWQRCLLANSSLQLLPT